MAEPDAAVAIVHAHGAADSVLLIRRAEREADPWSGHWSFPGGRRESSDSGPLHTALRELAEECGIHLPRQSMESALSAAVARRKVGRFLLVAPFVFRVAAEQPVSLDPREAAEAVWVRLSVLRDPARHALRPVPALPPEVLFPAIDLNGLPLWGFTYRLITDWLGLNPREALAGEAGFQVARTLLNAVVAHGCVLEHGWADREGVKVATVRGAIPVQFVRTQVPWPSGHIPPINRLEVRREAIRVAGLAFEEYVIEALP
ncbi:MAG: CoA pyrophosphatase [Bryobacteraceae bacterium]|jgi:8-oxo-dGTP pyrophosphatase MutT (NUDIX family)